MLGICIWNTHLLLPLVGIVNSVINSTADILQTESAFWWAKMEDCYGGGSVSTQCLSWKAFISTSQGGKWLIY